MNQNSNQVGAEELRLLGTMLEDPIEWHYSLEIGIEADIAPGTIYPALAKLEKSGWMESRWDTGEGGAPRRRLYRLTGVGQRCAASALVGQATTSVASRRRRFGFGLPRTQGTHS